TTPTNDPSPTPSMIYTDMHGRIGAPAGAATRRAGRCLESVGAASSAAVAKAGSERVPRELDVTAVRQRRRWTARQRTKASMRRLASRGCGHGGEPGVGF